MQLLKASRPEHGKLLIVTAVDEAGGLTVWQPFDVWLDRQQLPALILRQRQPAAAEQDRAALLAVQQFEHPVLCARRVAENPCAVKQRTNGAVFRHRSGAVGIRARPEALDISEEPVKAKLRESGGAICVAERAGNQESSGGLMELVGWRPSAEQSFRKMR